MKKILSAVITTLVAMSFTAVVFAADTTKPVVPVDPAAVSTPGEVKKEVKAAKVKAEVEAKESKAKAKADAKAAKARAKTEANEAKERVKVDAKAAKAKAASDAKAAKDAAVPAK